MKILILGHRGMLGNVVYKFFIDRYEIQIIDEKYRWDSGEYKSLILTSDADFIINCVGAIPQKKYSKYYYEFLNVDLPMFLETTGKRIIHPSTDCEFSGKLKFPQKYTKEDIRDADDDYGMSKAKISKMIVENFSNTKIIRTSIIGHEVVAHLSLLDWFLGVEEGGEVNGYVNYFWNGITTLQWAKIAEQIVSNWDNYEIMVQVGTEGMHKCDLLRTIKRAYNKSVIINEFNMDVSLNKILESDYEIPSIEEQLIELKKYYNK